MFKTIVALATAPMKSALAIVRLSGDDCFDIVNNFFDRDLNKVENKSVLFGKIVNNDETIDQVVLLAYKAPHGFTGENSVEIICHGSVLIAEQIISLAIKFGATYASGGEFSSRAFLNGKMGIIEAEAINDVINATTAEAKKLAMFSIEGKTRQLVLPIKEKVADILSLIEVNIDYPEYEDIEIATKEKIRNELREIVFTIESTIQNGYKGKVIKDGINLALVGKPNAGKSSLLNSLINEQKAIVTSIPGTTRDVVEGSINIKGITINIQDTAGIRNSDDVIEMEGIRKSKEAINKADLILYLVECGDTNEDVELLKLINKKKYIKVYNKMDTSNDKFDDGVMISAINNDIENLKTEIIKVLDLNEENYQNPSINNIRELGLLEKVYDLLKNTIQENDENQTLDLIAIYLQEAYELLLDVLGESSTVDFTKEIFSRFCVGK